MNSEAPERQSQVDEQLSMANNTLDQLNTVISQLFDKLQPVMRGPEPSEDCKEQVKDDLVPLANQIRIIRNKIENEVRRVSDILCHFEL